MALQFTQLTGNTKYDISATDTSSNGNPAVVLSSLGYDAGETDEVEFIGGGTTTVTTNGDKIIISSTGVSSNQIATTSALGLVKSSTTTDIANRYYNVQVNSDGTMKVNVPWEEYESKAAASNGTAPSLVTTGEKYIWNSKTSNTGTVIGSNLTDGYFVMGNGGVNVDISSMKPTTSSTSWSTSSDVNVPTMKAISSYVTGIGYTKNTGTVIGSNLTDGYFVMGNGGVNVDISSMKPTTSSTSWSDSSDVNVPTMKAISSYVVGSLSNYAANSHTHGNINNGGQITATESTTSNVKHIAVCVDDGGTVKKMTPANVRTAIGAGTSNFTGYTSSNKLAASNVSGLATVATSGSYNDLSNKPTIPTLAGNGSATTASKSDHTHSYAASTSAGGAATNINVTAQIPNGTSYYCLYSASTSGSQDAKANADLYYTGGTGWTSFNVGKASGNGILTLHRGSNVYGNLQIASLTANRTYTFPNASGTVALVDDLPTFTYNATTKTLTIS